MRLGKVCTSILFLFTIVNIHAQNIASRTPSNKNVVLEELTGKGCVSCPSGHKLGSWLIDRYPDRVFILSINAGFWAGGTPNYTTVWGDYIDSIFTVGRYPNAAVNRTDFGEGIMQDAGEWNDNTQITLSQSSPVNIGGEATVNLVTRELTVDVETYYVYSVPGPYQRIHAVITQDNVAGYQKGAMEHNPEKIIVTGQYMHMHMVRHGLTPVLGDFIYNLSATSLNINSYQYTVPTEINGIPVNIEDLNIVVYVSEKEEHSEVITANHAHFNYVIPPDFNEVDYTIKGDTTKLINLCDHDYHPSAWVYNRGAFSVDTMMVRYKVRGKETQDSILYVGSVLPGDSVLINFPPSNSLISGILTYTVQVTDYNAKTAELFLNNNVSHINIGLALNNVNSYTIHEHFEDAITNSTQMIHGVHVNPERVDAKIFGPGAFQESNSSFIWTLRYTDAGKKSQIFLNKIKIPPFSQYASIGWTYGYAQRGVTNMDRLHVQVSIDCGASWTSIWDKDGADLATAPAIYTTFVPALDEWSRESVDLSQFAGQEIIITFEVTCDEGNSLWLDDINLDIDCSQYATTSVAACETYTSPSGNYTWTSSGNYQDTIQNIYGCDSVININLTIDAEFDAGVEQNGSEIYSTLSSASSYLWLDCNQDYKAIVWATNQYFSPPYDGVYAVEVTKNSCVDTSDCFYFKNSSIGESSLNAQLSIQPNPAKNEVSVTLDSPAAFSLTVVNMLGEIILVKENVMHKTMVDLTKVENGLYYFHVKTDKSTVIKKIIKAE
jgi:hypothetical protein